MRRKYICLRPALLAFMFASAVMFGACGVTAPSDSEFGSVKSDGAGNEIQQVAAYVNGEPVPEVDITTYVSDFRYAHGLSDDSSWIEWLDESDQTPQSMRSSAIDYFAKAIVLRQAAEKLGIDISKDEIDAELTQSQSEFASQEEWEESLRTMGLNESTYRMSIESSLIERKVKDGYSDYRGDSEALSDYVNAYASAYDGSRKSSFIKFSSSDYDLAESVLSDLRSEKISFEEAAAEYSNDLATKASGGNIGWDALTIAPSQDYSKALSELKVGQISDLVLSGDSIYIIKCTDQFIANGNESIDQLPEEFQQSIYSSIDDSEKSEQFTSWLNEQIEDSDIDIIDMPEGLSYDVKAK